MNTKPSLFANVRLQFDKAADLMGLDPEIRKILAQTKTTSKLYRR